MAVVPEATLEALSQIVAGKYFFAAAMTMLFYDHLLTFPLEVQVIWKRPKTYLSYLFLLVRYYAVLAVSVVAFGYFSTTMTRERCGHWMLFLPLGVTMPLALFPGVLMSIRVYALYNRNAWILGWLIFYLCCQTGAGLWQYTVPGGTPAPDPLPNNQNFHFCIYLPPKKIGHLSTMYVFMELGFDSMAFILTVARTTYIHWHQRRRFAMSSASRRWASEKAPSSLLSSLFRDGAFYFGIIFSINLVWVVMILHAPTGLRAIASVPSGCFITTMISRITLNLRSTAYGPANLDERTGATTAGFTVSMPLSDMRRTPRGESFSLATAHTVTTVYNDEGELLDDIDTPRSGLPFLNGNGYGNNSFGPRAV
ncbi:hypothetical protein PENSPDRAFT_506743 [Peniophora sp. CONT]|nr:hypothetical protein PENSPDRAFT_506743 [Peniophora sp. CONT]